MCSSAGSKIVSLSAYARMSSHSVRLHVMLHHLVVGDLCSKSGKNCRQRLAYCLFFLFEYANEAVNGPQRVVCLMVWSRKRHGKTAEIFLLDHEIMPTPQIVLQGTQVLHQEGGFFAWE